MLNKKILAAAIIGGLVAAGSATAAPLSVTKQYYAQEIIIPSTGLVPATAPALSWNIGYNFSPGEVKYVRVELTGATFQTMPVAPTVAGGAVGAINGLGTNVLTFSVTSNTPGIVGAAVVNVALANNINIPAQGDVSAEVSLYDQASQAQAGGSTGRLAIGSFDDTVFLGFTKSYEFKSVANTLTADVASAGVAYNDFLADGTTVPATTAGVGTLNNNLSVQLVDPDGTTGPQAVTYAANGAPITLATLFGGTSKIEVEGDYAGATGVTLGGASPVPAFVNTATKLTWTAVPTGAIAPLLYTNGAVAIPAGDFKATFTPASATPALYAVTPLSVNTAGSIRRNGLELQAPLVQVPGGWISRLVLTNTGSTSPKYSIRVLGEAGNTISTANLTGTIPANSTYVVEDLKTLLTSFTGAPRATLVVTVEAKDAPGAGAIQGLYQIVNPDKGSISNHVLVRPGTN